ncbi:hypothetical protein Tco_1113851 [Tanacetum coccineum]|uniref:Uncharacterized protein n=1 Tax=Tanacetum coccineum TaxID=301880 RepID=A0ABQ5IWB4_9ASTR
MFCVRIHRTRLLLEIELVTISTKQTFTLSYYKVGIILYQILNQEDCLHPLEKRNLNNTVDQGMSVEEIERVIAERVANAIEAIAIYETKTNMALSNSEVSETLWDKKISTPSERQAENKRKLNNIPRQSEPNNCRIRGKNTGKAVAAGQ